MSKSNSSNGWKTVFSFLTPGHFWQNLFSGTALHQYAIIAVGCTYWRSITIVIQSLSKWAIANVTGKRGAEVRYWVTHIHRYILS